MSRIDNIVNFAQRKEEEKVAAEIALQQKIEDYKIQIRALKPRIDELIKVGNACLEYNIPLEGSSWGGHEGYDTHQFFTNSWSHLVGFVSNKNRPVTHLGIRAGGACGVWDFYTNGVDIYDAHEKLGR